MTSHQVLESVAKSLVTAGVYTDEEAAIRAMAVEQVEKKIAAYGAQVQTFEEKYHHSLDEYGRLLEGRASMEEEDEWRFDSLWGWQKSIKSGIGFMSW